MLFIFYFHIDLVFNTTTSQFCSNLIFSSNAFDFFKFTHLQLSSIKPLFCGNYFYKYNFLHQFFVFLFFSPLATVRRQKLTGTLIMNMSLRLAHTNTEQVHAHIRTSTNFDAQHSNLASKVRILVLNVKFLLLQKLFSIHFGCFFRT